MTRRTLILLAVALLAILSYATSLESGFAYDDTTIIGENPRVLEPARMGEAWTTPYWGSRAGGGLYRPLVTLSFALNHRLHGLQPFGYHLVNVLLHAAVSGLVVLVAWLYLPPLAAGLAGALFAVHPIHVEAVANVVGRAELMAAFGFLLAWLAARRAGEAAGGSAWAWRLLAMAAWGAALLSKEVAIGLPVVIVAVAWLERRPIDKPLLLGFAFVLGGYLAARGAVLGAVGMAKEMVIYRLDNVIATQPYLPGLWTALSVFGRYLVLLVFPWRLSADYSWAQIREAGPGDPWAWLGLLGAIGLAIVLIRAVLAAGRGAEAARASRGEVAGASLAAAVGLLVFGAAFLPVSNFVVRIGTIMGERLLYLPSAGFLIAVAAGAHALARRDARVQRTLAVVAGVLVVLGAARCLTRSRDWKSDATLHATTVRTSPGSARAHFNAAPPLWAADRRDDAIAEARAAVTIDSTYTEAWMNLGGYLVKEGRYDEARRALTAALASTPGDEYSELALGALELEVGQPAAAVPWFEHVARRNPARVEAWYNLGLARQALGDTAAAIRAFRSAVGARPEAPDPDAQNNLAWLLLLTARTPAEREGAVAEARRGVALRADASGYDTLAESLHRAGRTPEAIEAWKKVLELGAADPDSLRRKLAALEAEVREADRPR